MQWSQIVRTILILKGKWQISHLDGTGLSSDDPKFQAWDEEDLMIMSWIWNSMQPEISRNLTFLPTVQDIWEMLQKTYSMKQDAVMISELKTQSFIYGARFSLCY